MASDMISSLDKEAALTAARILLEIKAVNFRASEPYTLTSGWKSPVYIDCRKIIFYPRARAELMKLAVEKICRHIGYESLDLIVGGETAGIPFAAWIADYLNLPMAYVRKKPKGFGRNAQIEGDLKENMKTLLVEDLTTDGASKIHFANALRKAGAELAHTFVIFYYGVFPGALETLKDAGLNLISLTTWHEILEICKQDSYFSEEDRNEVQKFLDNPCEWSEKHGGITKSSGPTVS
ncbi:orotate phosphoribosyltransferase [Acetobacteraceae bacterium]|nr:orotate phosphoribosyltransferase [Acetobacteraceae bacterium]